MKQTKLLMGMPITVEILGEEATTETFTKVYDYFSYVDEKYSTYKTDSEISQINRGLPKEQWSHEMKTVMELCEQTKRDTSGYFDINIRGHLDPSGLVKGWAINNAAELLIESGIVDFYIDAGGDVQPRGANSQKMPWRIGIRNPFNRDEVIKVVAVSDGAVATSGTYIRGQHIYNPHDPDRAVEGVVSISVIGPNIYEADRFATAAFAMGPQGISFIEHLPGFEGYLIDPTGKATLTTGFDRYVVAS